MQAEVFLRSKRTPSGALVDLYELVGGALLYIPVVPDWERQWDLALQARRCERPRDELA